MIFQLLVREGATYLSKEKISYQRVHLMNQDKQRRQSIIAGSFAPQKGVKPTLEGAKSLCLNQICIFHFTKFALAHR